MEQDVQLGLMLRQQSSRSDQLALRNHEADYSVSPVTHAAIQAAIVLLNFKLLLQRILVVSCQMPSHRITDLLRHI